jgi:CRP-like cAMP-binding protein
MTTNHLIVWLRSRHNELDSQLKTVTVGRNHILFDVGEIVGSIYFPLDAIVSLVVPLQSGKMIEAAMVGRDGVVGASAALDGSRSVSRAVIQNPGKALSWDATSFKRVAMEDTKFHAMIMAHEQSLYAQAQQSAACNISHGIDERLARWLSRAHDLVAGDELGFTQEFLAEMLGVRRSSVSPAAMTLQNRGLIEYTRGKIRVVNREGLRAAACECYEANREVYDMTMGPHLGVRQN